MKKLMIAFATVLLLPFFALAHGDSGYSKQQECREFRKIDKIHSKKQTHYGVACRYDRLSAWELVSDDNVFGYRKGQGLKRRFIRKKRVYVPSFGFHVDLGRRLAQNRRNVGHHANMGYKGNAYGYGDGKWLKIIRQENRARWRERGGNSYSHLIQKSRNIGK